MRVSLAALPGVEVPCLAFLHRRVAGAREAIGRGRLTVNLLKPLILPGWSCISTSSFAEASAVEGSDSTLRVFAVLAILPVGAVRGERSQTYSRKGWQAVLEADCSANGASG